MPVAAAEVDSTSDANKMTFLSLPNEIITKVFQKLDKATRTNLAMLSGRLGWLEFMAGYNRFQCIGFYARFKANAMCIAADLKRVPSNDSRLLQNMTTYLKFGYAKCLKIGGRFTPELRMIFQAIMKTIKFTNLEMSICDDHSVTILSELICQSEIKEVSISFPNRKCDANKAKAVLLELPPINICNINTWDSVFIDDVVLLHIVSNSSSYAHINCLYNSITAVGLARAFEMMYRRKCNRKVIFYVNEAVFDEFISHLDPVKFEKKSIRITHIESGATLDSDIQAYDAFYTTFLSLPNEVMTKIFEYLNLEDRANLASLDGRLAGVEAETGYRRFEHIAIISNPLLRIMKISADGEEIFIDDVISETVTSFNYATAQWMHVKGQYYEDSEEALFSATKTIKFAQLHIELVDECSVRILKEVAQAHKELSLVHINLLKTRMSEECKKEVLSDLPHVHSYIISVASTLIDDEMLLQLASNCSSYVKIDCVHNNLTASGVTRARQETCSKGFVKTVEFSLKAADLESVLGRAISSKKLKRGITVKHRGASFDCYQNRSDLVMVTMSNDPIL